MFESHPALLGLLSRCSGDLQNIFTLFDLEILALALKGGFGYKISMAKLGEQSDVAIVFGFAIFEMLLQFT